MNRAADTLHRAAAIMEQRAVDYDSPGGERSMGRTVAAFNAITGGCMTRAEGWLFMVCLKLARQSQNTDRMHTDSMDDAAAYVALMAEELSA